jgi:hypothetical protein
VKFYYRKKELEVLETLYRNKPSFVVVTGKRRVGKTEIIKQFLKGKKSLYLFADSNKSETILLAEFEEYIKNELKVKDYIKFKTYGQMLEFLLDYGEDLVVAIDEFQRFLDISPSFITDIQKHWDLRGDKSRLMLLISGSSVGMMKKIFVEKKAPLFKRADNIITLRPFSIREIFTVLEDLGLKDAKEKFDVHCLFGGTIFYYRLMEKYEVRSFDNALDRLLLSDIAPLRNEVKDILVEEFGKEHPTYYEILSAMAMGKSTKKEIGDVTHISANSLSPYFYDLIDILGVAGHEVPVTETPGRTKKGRYVLKDNFFRFYFRFIYRNMSLYQRGDYDAILGKVKADWNDFKGRLFEDIALDYATAALGSRYPEIGRFWDRRGNEIDVVGLNPKNGEMFLGESKLRELSADEALEIIRGLAGKAELVPFRAGNVRYGIFAQNVKDREKVEKEGHFVGTLNDIIGA